MANASHLIGWGFTESADGQDLLTATYRVQYDTRPSTAYAALAQARTYGPDPVPPRRQQFISPTAWMFAQGFSAQSSRTDDSAKVIEWTVTYGPPPAGEPPESYGQDNPLARPPIPNIEYMDIEEVIDKAKNVGALPHGDGSGGNRADGTEGPVANAAGKRPDVGMVRTGRLEVLVITKNYPSLSAIVARNRAYKQTTNSDTPEGYGVRELRYLLTESHGEMFENGIRFWPGTTRILAEKTTDLIIDNVGYDYWSPVGFDPAGAPGNTDGYWVKAGSNVIDEEGNSVFEPAAEPINLKIDGDKGGTTTTTITYRDLAPVAYAGLFT